LLALGFTILGPCSRPWTSAVAIGISAVVFAFDPFMIHTFRHLHWIALWDGTIWGILWVRTHNLFLPIVAHAVEVIIMYSVIRTVLFGCRTPMNPSLSSYLVNDVFGDPGVYVEVRWSKRAFLFDLGQNDALGPTRLLRASDIFISHPHMDHFVGFDAVLRVALGRGKTLRLYGPPHLIANVQGKLNGYTWNLVDGYPLTIEVREFHGHEIRLA